MPAADGRTLTVSLYATAGADFDVDGHPADERDAMRLAYVILAEVAAERAAKRT